MFLIAFWDSWLTQTVFSYNPWRTLTGKVFRIWIAHHAGATICTWLNGAGLDNYAIETIKWDNDKFIWLYNRSWTLPEHKILLHDKSFFCFVVYFKRFEVCTSLVSVIAFSSSFFTVVTAPYFDLKSSSERQHDDSRKEVAGSIRLWRERQPLAAYTEEFARFVTETKLTKLEFLSFDTKCKMQPAVR